MNKSAKKNEEGPILFKGAMVRAIVNGQKIMTRRVRGLGEINKDPYNYQLVECSPKDGSAVFADPEGFGKSLRCPYGHVGKKLWVRETWTAAYGCGSYENPTEGWGYFKWDEKLYGKMTADGIVKETAHSGMCLFYRADGEDALPAEFSMPHGNEIGWRPSIHMPMWASRITLRVNAVRVERLQEITEADAIAEGIVREDSAYAIYLDDGVAFRCATAREVFAQLWEHINGAGSWDTNPWVWVVGFEVEGVRK